MRRLLLFVCALTAFLPCLRAQYEVGTSLSAKSFLLFEGIPVRVEITNRSAQPLHIGGRDPEGIVRLSVRNTRNEVIPRTRQPLLPDAWVIPPGATDSREFDLVQLFQIRRADSYRASVVVEIDLDAFTSAPMLFDVTNGTLFEKVVRRRTDRTFSLLGINRNGRDELMLRVSDAAEDTPLATYFLERHLRFYPPQMRADERGRIGIFHYSSPSQAVLCTFEPDGTPIRRDYYRVFAGRPAELRIHPETGFAVDGAERLDPQE